MISFLVLSPPPTSPPTIIGLVSYYSLVNVAFKDTHLTVGCKSLFPTTPRSSKKTFWAVGSSYGQVESFEGDVGMDENWGVDSSSFY